METFRYLSFQYFTYTPLYLACYGIIWSVILATVYTYVKKGNHSNTSPSILPGQKLPLFSVYGFLGALPSYGTMKKLSLPTTLYAHQMSTGLAMMFCKEKLVGTSLGFKKIILLTKWESLEEFFNSNVPTNKPFVEMLIPFFGTGLFTSTGQKWKNRRKLLNPIFRYDIIKEFLPVFDKQSRVLVDTLYRRCGEEEIDITHPVALCTLDMIFGTFLGGNVGEQKDDNSQFLRRLDRVLQTVMKRTIQPLYHFESVFMMTSMGKQFKEDLDYLRSFAMQIIQERRATTKHRNGRKKEHSGKQKDVLDLFLEIQNNILDVSDEDLRDELLSFVFGGQDTTSVAVTWSLYLIGLHPEVQCKIQEELDGTFGNDIERPVTEEDLKNLSYLECVMKECQRIYPPVPMIPKEVLEDFVLYGYKVKRGTVIAIDTYDIHRDPQVFPNPEVFDPDRFLPANCTGRSPYAYIPFSAGVRNCVGRRFAMMEIKTLLANVLRRLSLKSLEHRDKICMTVDLLLRPIGPVKMKFIPRKNE